MAGPFIHENFLLETNAAVRLYHGYAKHQPIIDYHSHLPPDQIARDHQFKNLTEIWLYGDHYKWRLLRTNGVPERYITGDASDWDKFLRWAQTVPRILRNPIYHWTHLELKRPFGITDRLLNARTAKGIWDECNAKLALPRFSCRGILQHWDVVLLCTTDDPVDSLEHHKAIAADDSIAVQVRPAFRPDKAMAVESAEAFNAWVDKLAAASDVHIVDFASYLDAIRRRYDFFDETGCRISDHGTETFYAADYTDRQIASIFDKIRGDSELDSDEVVKFKSAMLYELALLNCEKGWTQQFHIGALRNNNTRLLSALGRDVGCDSMGDWHVAQAMSRLLDRLDRQGKLARTIVYSLNPCHNELLTTMIGNFQDGTVVGKLQVGSAWWFNDQIDGILKHLEAISTMGLLSPFVGMLTDSRSFLSYARHEYFRRILCNLLGGEMQRGLLPSDFGLVGGLVQDLCYRNAARYFGFEGLAPGA